jgi:AcrR family transcriptional regulator
MDVMRAPTRRGRPPKAEAPDTRQAILDAALDLFARQGYAGTSIRQIARAVGISEAGLYAHFASKRGVYDALIATGGPAVVLGLLDDLTQHRGARPPEDPPAFLEELALGAIELWDEPRARRLLSVLIREGAASGLEGDTSLVAAIAQVQRRLGPWFAHWIAAGRVRPVAAPEHLVWELFAPLNAIRILYLHATATEEERRVGHAQARQHIAFFLAAVCPCA